MDSLYDAVLGPALAAPVLREAIPVHTCTRCWCQQAMGLPCWLCGGPAWHWEPPALPGELHAMTGN